MLTFLYIYLINQFLAKTILSKLIYSSIFKNIFV